MKAQELDLKGQEMIDKSNSFVSEAQEDDDLVVFYSGHGEVDGLIGVDNKVLPPATVADWMGTVLTKGSRLIVIIEACHSESIADYIRNKECISIRNSANQLGKTKASELSQIAQSLQHVKDRLSKIERAKQKLMEEPDVSQLMKTNKLDDEIYTKEKAVHQAWDTELPQIKTYADQVMKLTGKKLKLPKFEKKDKSVWLHSQQHFDLDSMTNAALELARQALR